MHERSKRLMGTGRSETDRSGPSRGRRATAAIVAAAVAGVALIATPAAAAEAFTEVFDFE